MCRFSQPVELVADTSIFARSDIGRQFLVYSMSHDAPFELAMALPLPVPADPSEDAVRFINFHGVKESGESEGRAVMGRIGGAP